MKHIKLFENFIDEISLNEAAVNVTTKDWDRMMDLVLKGDLGGDKVIKLIKGRNKAMVRFIAGLKLTNAPLKYTDSTRYQYGSVPFAKIGELALSFGATPDAIQNLYDSTEVPKSIIEKMNKRSGKKLDNRFVGVISKTVLDEGGDIEYLPHRGNAITRMGKDAMSRSGRKWTIGYKAVITINKNKYDFVFDAITDEGDGPTLYSLDGDNSSLIFNEIDSYKTYGRNDFISKLKEILQSLI